MALAADVKYNIGRVAMHCFPLYLPFAVLYIATISDSLLKTDHPDSA